MDKRVYLLTIVSFVVGMVELIIGGILDIIAADLHVSIGKIGLLITVFSLIFAIAPPFLLIFTAKIERKKLTIISLFIFLIGNIISVFSPNYAILLLARIISATSGSLLIILCITIASSIVERRYIARSIGIVVMGISGSLVLGIPIGLMLSDAYGWRAPFVLITFLTMLSILGVYFFMHKIEPKPAIPLMIQIRSLKDRRIFFAHVTMFLYLSGHIALYAYLTPYIKELFGFDAGMISIVYLLFGIAAVSGGGLSGGLTDHFGPKKVILTVIIILASTLFLIPYTAFSTPLFFVLLIIWGMMSWSISPALQSYLIQLTPKTAEIQQSLNNSALHFGIAFGSLVGSFVIDKADVTYNPTVGGILIVFAFATSLVTLYKGKNDIKKSISGGV